MIAAARNNAEWCDLVCRSHGIPTAYTPGFWYAAGRTPQYYPDAVTLAPGTDPDDMLRHIDTSPGCSIKDSFATMDLAPHGFELLFEARWIRRPPHRGRPLWSRARTAADLHPWPATIRPELLADPAVAVFTAGAFAAGAIANRSARVVGLSNLFAAGMPLDEAWRDAASTISAFFPGLPLVGYERPAGLPPAVAAGFSTTGPLRVWIKP